MREETMRGWAFLFPTLLLLLWGCAGREAPKNLQEPVSLFLERVRSRHPEVAQHLDSAQPGSGREEVRLRMRPGWERRPLAARENEAILLARAWVEALTQPRGKGVTALANWFPIEKTSLPERAMVRYWDSGGRDVGWAEFRRDRGLFLKWTSSP